MNKTLNQLSLTILGLTALTTAACSGEEDVDSSAIRTQGMYADFSAVSTGNGTTVTAQLRVGGDDGTIVKLTSPDELVGTVGDQKKTLGAINNRERYRASFSEDAGGTPVNIDFQRGPDDDGAPDSDGEMPKPFSLGLSDVDTGDDIQRGDDVRVDWDPPVDGDTIFWDVDGDCIWPADGEAADDGTLTIAAADIEVHNLDAGESCEVTVTLERSLPGDLDPAYQEGGQFWLIQRRTVIFNSTPAPDETGDTTNDTTNNNQMTGEPDAGGGGDQTTNTTTDAGSAADTGDAG